MTGTTAAPTDDAAVLRYTCGGASFDPALLLGPTLFELDGHPAAVSLRRFADRPWRLVALDDRRAWYVAESEGDSPFVHAELELGPGGWEVSGWGDCRPQLAIAGANPAFWTFDPKEAIPGPESTSFTALVTETSCASGQPAGDRVFPPLVLYERARILVAFTVRPLGGSHFCPGNPATRVVVDLREALGNRVLLDAGIYPPHDPTQPWP